MRARNVPLRTYGDKRVLGRWAGARDLDRLPISTVDRPITIPRPSRINSRLESEVWSETPDSCSVWNPGSPLEF